MKRRSASPPPFRLVHAIACTTHLRDGADLDLLLVLNNGHDGAGKLRQVCLLVLLEDDKL